MTFKQIEKIVEYIDRLKKLKDNPKYDEIYYIDDEIRNFFGEKYKGTHLNVGSYIFHNFKINDDDARLDIRNIISILEGMIAEDDRNYQVCEIINLISEGERLNQQYDVKQRFISKVYYSYNDVIVFDKSIESIAKESLESKDFSGLSLVFSDKKNIDEEVIRGIIHKLRTYAISLLNVKKEIKETANHPTQSPPVVINNTNNAISNNSVNVTSEIIFENIKKQILDEGLGDDQEKDILEKISELENIAKSNESKGKRWAKAKEVMKWLVEQGIQVAGIILPAISQSIK